MKFKTTSEQERSQAIFGRTERLTVFAMIACQEHDEINVQAMSDEIEAQISSEDPNGHYYWAGHVGAISETVRDLQQAGVLLETTPGKYRRNPDLDWDKLEAALDELVQLGVESGN
jgi:hypothetical protein